MKRIIKFRGKWHYSNEWVYGYLVKYSDADIQIIQDGAAFKVLPETVGQFTGRFDCVGNEIYDGDIFEFDHKEWGDNETNKHLCSWDDKQSEWCWGGGGNGDMDYRTIIGNIHDNKDILK